MSLTISPHSHLRWTCVLLSQNELLKINICIGCRDGIYGSGGMPLFEEPSE